MHFSSRGIWADKEEDTTATTAEVALCSSVGSIARTFLCAFS